jgi:hypothetical protein
VRLPTGILIPGEIGNLLANADDIRLTVFIEIGDDDRVSALGVGLNDVILKLDDLLASSKAGSGDEQQQGSAHNMSIIHPA